MKIKRFQDFSINESFGISKELNDFIRSKSLDWSDFEDSLWDIKDDSDFEIKKSCELVDLTEEDLILNIDAPQEEVAEETTLTEEERIAQLEASSEKPEEETSEEEK